MEQFAPLVRSKDQRPIRYLVVDDSIFARKNLAKMIESFGGVGVNATSPDELRRAVNEAMDSGKPTLINAVLDPAAGSESGRIGNLNPQSKLKKK